MKKKYKKLKKNQKKNKIEEGGMTDNKKVQFEQTSQNGNESNLENLEPEKQKHNSGSDYFNGDSAFEENKFNEILSTVDPNFF